MHNNAELIIILNISNILIEVFIVNNINFLGFFIYINVLQ
jgi:hypothetical protein